MNDKVDIMELAVFNRLEEKIDQLVERLRNNQQEIVDLKGLIGAKDQEILELKELLSDQDTERQEIRERLEKLVARVEAM